MSGAEQLMTWRRCRVLFWPVGLPRKLGYVDQCFLVRWVMGI